MQEFESGKKGDAVHQKEESSFEIIELYHHLVTKFWRILLVAAIAALLAGAYGKYLAAPRNYAATAKIYTVSQGEDGTSYSSLQIGSVLSKDYLELFKTWEIHALVRSTLGINYTDSELTDMLTVRNIENSHVIYITVSRPDPQEAISLANAYASAAQMLVVQKLGVGIPGVFSEAETAELTYGATTFMFLLSGFLIGAILAVGVVCLRFFFDESPKTPEDIERFGDMPTLAVLPHLGMRFHRFRPYESPGNAPSEQREQIDGHPLNRLNMLRIRPMDADFDEAMDALYANLSYSKSMPGTVMITSRYRREGKTLVSVHLMKILSQMKKSVVLVDADLRFSEMPQKYGLQYLKDDPRSLVDYLAERCEIADVVYRTNLPNAFLVPAGHVNARTLKLIASERMEVLLRRLATLFDVVLVDTPPSGLFTDASAIARACGGMIFVVNYGRGSCRDIDKTRKALDKTGCTRLGAVMNRVDFKSHVNRKYYYTAESQMLGQARRQHD